MSRLSGNDDAMKPGTEHGSPAIYLAAEENPGKPQIEDNLINAVQPVIDRMLLSLLWFARLLTLLISGDIA